MSTTRLSGDDNIRKRNWKVSRWILCPAQKGKPLHDTIIVSRVVQLKNTSSFGMYSYYESLGKTKLPSL
jgi:hypothetical protein